MRFRVRYVDEPAVQDRRAVHIVSTERIRKPAFPCLDTLGVPLGYGSRPYLIAVG